MREALLLLAAAGCVMIALLAGKTPSAGWGDVLTSVAFAGSAGVLLAAVAD
jgi:hypothetical protein